MIDQMMVGEQEMKLTRDSGHVGNGSRDDTNGARGSEGEDTNLLVSMVETSSENRATLFQLSLCGDGRTHGSDSEVGLEVMSGRIVRKEKTLEDLKTRYQETEAKVRVLRRCNRYNEVTIRSLQKEVEFLRKDRERRCTQGRQTLDQLTKESERVAKTIAVKKEKLEAVSSFLKRNYHNLKENMY